MQYLTVSEVAQWLQISKQSVRNQVKTRTIPHLRIRNEIRFSKTELLEWIGFDVEGELPETLTAQQLAESLKVGDQIVIREIRDGNLHAFRIGRLWRIPRQSFDEWVENSLS